MEVVHPHMSFRDNKEDWLGWMKGDSLNITSYNEETTNNKGRDEQQHNECEAMISTKTNTQAHPQCFLHAPFLNGF